MDTAKGVKSMGRPKKAGLDYYYKDVDFMEDYRIMQLMNQYGTMGYMVLEIVVSRVYKNGYYLETPFAFLAAQIIRLIGNRWMDDPAQVIEIIEYCGEIGIFDPALLRQSVITSEEIQRNYSFVTARRNADKTKYWLLPEEEVESKKNAKDSANSHQPKSNRVYAAETPEYVTQTPVYHAKTPEYATETRVYAAETPEYVTQNRVYAAETPEYVTQNRVYATETPEYVTQNRVYATETPEYATENRFFAAESAQSKAKEIKENDSKANQSKAEQPGVQKPLFYADADAAAAADEYKGIDSAYHAATGRILTQSDISLIHELIEEGASEAMIESTVREVASRNHQKINSFRYFAPIVRQRLTKNNAKYHSSPYYSNDDGMYGFHSGGMIKNGMYQSEPNMIDGRCMTSEDIEELMSYDLIHYQPDPNMSFDYDDG